MNAPCSKLSFSKGGMYFPKGSNTEISTECRPGGRVWAGGAWAPPLFGKNRVKHRVGPHHFFSRISAGPTTFKIVPLALVWYFTHQSGYNKLGVEIIRTTT